MKQSIEQQVSPSAPETNWNFQLPATGFLRLFQILAFLPISRSTFLAGIKSGRYPLTPVKLSERCTAYRVEEVKALIESLAGGK